ncbi:MAG: hypothetical protein PHD48_06445 [Alphaproteobacteria bacterium]|nr:hypothetical protein [Alphaproteobacteria bacterium]
MAQAAKIVSSDEQNPVNGEAQKITIEDLPHVLKAKRNELRNAYNDTLISFVEDCSIADVEKKEKWVVLYELDILRIRKVLEEEGNTLIEKKAKAYNAQYEQLSKNAIELGNRLAAKRKDIAQRQKDAEFDLAKLFTFGIVFPSVTYNSLKDKFPNNPVLVTLASGFIFACGVSYHFRKSIKNAWKSTAEDLCPRSIKDSIGFTSYYVKVCAGEKKEALMSNFKSVGMAAVHRVQKIAPMRKVIEWKRRRDKGNGLS